MLFDAIQRLLIAASISCANRIQHVAHCGFCCFSRVVASDVDNRHIHNQICAPGSGWHALPAVRAVWSVWAVRLVRAATKCHAPVNLAIIRCQNSCAVSA